MKKLSNFVFNVWLASRERVELIEEEILSQETPQPQMLKVENLSDQRSIM